MRETPNLGLKVWDQPEDVFNPDELEFNWDALDADSVRARIAQQVEVLATVPSLGNFVGRLVYLSAADSGFQAHTLIRYNGSTWRNVGPAPEIFSSLPTVGNFAGRAVVLSGASGGFSAWDFVINTNGSTSWQKVGGLATAAALPGSPTAGQTVLLTAANGGFEAYDLVVYNGSAWQRTARRGVEVGTALPVSGLFAGKLFVLSAAASGFDIWDVVVYNGSSWGRVNRTITSGMIFPYAGSSAPSGYLLCDGSSVLRATYAELFAVIGTTYGSADGTHFTVPDLRGRVPVGKGSNGDVDVLGDNEGVAEANRSPRHNSTTSNLYVGDHRHPLADPTDVDASLSGATKSVTSTSGIGAATTGDPTSSAHVTGTVGPGSTRPVDTPAYLTINYIIKT